MYGKSFRNNPLHVTPPPPPRETPYTTLAPPPPPDIGPAGEWVGGWEGAPALPVGFWGLVSPGRQCCVSIPSIVILCGRLLQRLPLPGTGPYYQGQAAV